MDRRKQTIYTRRAVEYGGRRSSQAVAPQQSPQLEHMAPKSKHRKFAWTKRSVIVAAALLILGIGGGATYAQLGPSLTQSPSTGVNLQKGLIGWWKLDGNFLDSTPYNQNGTIVNASPTAANDREGRGNSAYTFDGTNRIINISNGYPGLTAVTKSVWVYMPANLTGSYETLFDSGSPGASVYMETFTAGVPRVMVGAAVTSGGGAFSGTSNEIVSGNLDTSRWHHIVQTVTSSEMRMYVDGVLFGTSSGTFDLTKMNQLTRIGGGRANLQGSLDDVRLYSHAINANEVKALYNSYNPALNVGSGEKGLVGWWKMDGNATDATPNRNNAVGTSLTAAPDRKNAANQSYSFNGSSSEMNVGTGRNLSFTNNFTLSAWIKPTTIKTGQSFGLQNMILARGPATTYNYALQVTSDTAISFIKRGPSESLQFNDFTGLSSLSNKWTFVTATISSGSIKLYVNGVLAGTQSVGTIGPRSDGSDTLRIGNSSGGLTGTYFTGSIDDARIYNRALNANEVNNQFKNYNSQISVNSYSNNVNTSTGLVGYWSFNGNANDSTPYRNNGSIVGSVAATTDRSNRANSAYTIPGTNGNYIAISASGTTATLAKKSFTVSTWTKITDAGGQKCIFSTAGGANGIRFGVGNGRPYYLVGNGTNYQEGGIGTTSLNNGQWRMLTIVYAYTTSWTLTAYIDGVSVGNTTIPSTIGAITATQAYIGTMNGGSNGNYPGSIDDLRIYNRALSQNDITALYNDYR